jgi:ribosomal protein S14
VQAATNTCAQCGSERLEYLQGYFATGVTGPNGEPEMYWREAVRCRDCGEVEEF